MASFFHTTLFRSLFFILALAFFAFPNLTQAQSTFNDTQGYIYEDSVEFLAKEGIVEGYADGSYGVNLLINRAEIAKVVTLGSEKELISSFNCFPDVLTEWFAIFVCTAKELGIVSGHDDGFYRPADNVNFVEAFKMVTEAYEIPLPNVSGEWFAPYVEYVHNENIFLKGSYDPAAKITRGQMAYLIHQVILRTEGGQPSEPTEPTNPTEPTEPTEPTQPTEPTEPTQPSVPQGPVSTDLGDLMVDASRLPFINTMVDRPDTSNWTVVPYNGPQTGAGVYGAVQALQPFSVLQLPDGNYSGALEIVGKNDVVVRGNCTDRSAVTWSNTGQPDNIIWADGPVCSPGLMRLCGGNYGQSRSDIFGPMQAWSGPYTRGTTTLNVDNASSFQSGQIVLIQSAPLSQPNTNIQTPRFTHMAEVVNVNGGSITIDSPLQIDFSNANASVQHLPGVLRNSGIECVTMNQTDASDPANLYNQTVLVMGNVWNSWIYNVDLGDTFNNHAIVEGAGSSLIAHTRFGNQMKSTRGDGNTCNAGTSVENNPCWNKQAILYRESHNNAFVNNVIDSSIGVETAHSSSGNWFAYNYFPEPEFHPSQEPRRALFPHGNYAYANVFEGNMFWGDTQMDEVWGSQGPYYTWFRNTAFSGRNGQGSFFNEVWADNPDSFVVSRFANYLLNFADNFGFPGVSMDTRSENMHLERNVYTSSFVHGTHHTASGTTASENQQGSPGSAWNGLDFPDTLNQSLSGVPNFWCSNTVSQGGQVCDFSIHGGVGALWDGSCILPAQARDEGLSCN